MFVLQLTEVWDSQYLQSGVVVKFIPFMSPIADIAADISVRTLVPWHYKQDKILLFTKSSAKQASTLNGGISS